jgi:hypothetical protein
VSGQELVEIIAESLEIILMAGDGEPVVGVGCFTAEGHQEFDVMLAGEGLHGCVEIAIRNFNGPVRMRDEECAGQMSNGVVVV